MITTHKYDGETWVDIDSGTPDEIRQVMDTYKIHPLLARELSGSDRKARVEFYGDYIYCILHFPAFKHSHGKEINQEVDFIIGRNILVTGRYDTIDSLHKFAKSLEVKEVLEKEHVDISGHFIFLGLLRELYQGLFDELSHIEDLTEDITRKIFQGRERDMVVAISEVTRTLLDFKKVTDLHHDVLDTLFHRGRAIFGEDFSRGIETIMLDYLKINSAIKNNLEMLRELRDTNDSLLSTKQNEIMKQLTVLGAVVLPLTIIAQLFGMSIRTFPLVDNPNAFWIILTMMCAVALCTLIYARHKKWI
jgi:magnesium transporter